jgi:hypothetical protein
MKGFNWVAHAMKMKSAQINKHDVPKMRSFATFSILYFVFRHLRDKAL